MRKIFALTGSRGEWGYIRPILKIIKDHPELEYVICATNMHLLSDFGLSIQEMELDGFKVEEKVYMTYAGYNNVTMAKSLGSLMMELPTILERVKPDIILLAGDRGEQIVGAMVGLHMGIPVAHIQAGELSGNVDGIVRHSITKLAHIHFAANEEFAQRVEKMGEQKERIHMTGAPLVDELVTGFVSSEESMAFKYRLTPGEPIILAVQHPVTEEESDAGNQVEETLKALQEINYKTIIIYPNSDAGSDLIRLELSNLKSSNFRTFRNLPRSDYLGFMKMAKCMVGNSSSGIMEAPTFGTPAVNIGRRQIGRPQSDNVINVEYEKKSIVEGIAKALTPEFQLIAKNCLNCYGEGNSSGKIVDILNKIEINESLLNKKMAY